MRRALTLAAIALISLRGAAHAQADTTFVIPRVPAGTLVRVWTSEPAMRRQLAIVEPSHVDSLRLRLDDAMVSVPVVGVERLDMQVPRTPGEGARRGLKMGLLTALVFDMVLFSLGQTDSAEGFDPTIGAIGVLATPTIVIGFTLKGIVSPGVRWTTAYLR